MEKSLPENFEVVNWLIEENKILQNNLRGSIEQLNKKNKPILVTYIKDNSQQKYLSITDTIRYFETLGIKLDRKTLNSYLKKKVVYIKVLVFNMVTSSKH